MSTHPNKLFASLCISLTLVLGFATSAYAGEGCSAASFKVPSSITLESSPSSIAAADFNGDGHLDLATLTSGGITILLGRGGAQSFGPPTTFPTAGSFSVLVAGDFNGDGRPDLVLTGGSNLSIALNDGNGSFSATSNIINGNGLFHSPIISDLNNDGKLDLLVGLETFSGFGKVLVLLGNGAGSFMQTPGSPLATNSLHVSSLVAGDFNEDGKPDFALPPEGGSGTDIFLGDGHGGFATTVNSPSSGFFGSSVTAGDFNGDGHLDIATSASRESFSTFFSGRVNVMRGDGTGHLSAPVTIPVPLVVSNVVARDVSNDGKLDLVLTGLSGMRIMLGNGTGGFVDTSTYSGNPGYPAFGDFNEDGKLEIALGLGSGIGIYSGDGTGAFDAPLRYNTNLNLPHEMVVADFNKDGKRDMAAVSTGYAQFTPGVSSIDVALGDGNGNFTRKSVIHFSAGTLLSSLVSADFNKDGNPDLAVTLPFPGKVAIILGDGNGSFPEDSSTIPTFQAFTPTPFGVQPPKIRSGDFDNDGNPDLVVLSPYSSNFVVLLGDGAGGFTTIQGEAAGVSTDIAIADFNSDGKLDLAISGSVGGSSRVSLYWGTGGGHFTNVDQHDFQQHDIVGVSAGDFNNDGKPDLAVSHYETTNGFLTVFLNNGSGGFAPRQDYSVEGAGRVGIGDFNSDGKADLAVPNGRYISGEGQSGVSVLTNDGVGRFVAPVSFAAGPPSDNLVVGDFNGDGKDDVLLVQPDVSSAAVLLNNFSAARQCLSVDDVTLTEGAAGTTNAVFTVKLSAASAQTVLINYYFETPSFFSTHPAQKGSDFVSGTGTLTFPPGTVMQTVTVPVKGDLMDEFDEFFYLRLTTPVNAVITDPKGIGTIVDDDAEPTISINDASGAEGNPPDAKSLTFTVSLSAASGKPITVRYELTAGTATGNTDYSNVANTVVFPAETQAQQVSVPIVADNTVEPNETFFINLSNASNATIADGQGQGTILNDDTATALQLKQSAYAATEADGHVALIVERTGDLSGTVTVNYATTDAAGLTPCSTANGAASSRCDYATTIGTFRFTPGETSKNIFIPLVDDAWAEGAETFTLTLSGVGGGSLGANTSATITVADNDSNSSAPNPIDQTPFFVRQQYIDFLGREPDSVGFQGWQNILNNCPVSGKDSAGNFCDRIEVSAGFFRSKEFQERGYFIYKFYSAVGKVPLYEEFMPDLAKVSGFLSDQQLEANKAAFVQEFMSRQEFQNKYGSITDPARYVDALLQTVGLPNHPSRGAWIDGLQNQTLTRGQVLRALTESSQVYSKYYTEAFVIMQYFGYLRRSADISYLTWIDIMNQMNGDYRVMIGGFLNSDEYRKRFGQ